jgi:hypothetical protein
MSSYTEETINKILNMSSSSKSSPDYIINIINKIISNELDELDKEIIINILNSELISIKTNILSSTNIENIDRIIIVEILDNISLYPSVKINKYKVLEIIKLISYKILDNNLEKLKQENKKIIEEYQNLHYLENIYEAINDGNYEYE